MSVLTSNSSASWQTCNPSVGQWISFCSPCLQCWKAGFSESPSIVNGTHTINSGNLSQTASFISSRIMLIMDSADDLCSLCHNLNYTVFGIGFSLSIDRQRAARMTDLKYGPCGCIELWYTLAAFLAPSFMASNWICLIMSSSLDGSRSLQVS